MFKFHFGYILPSKLPLQLHEKLNHFKIEKVLQLKEHIQLTNQKLDKPFNGMGGCRSFKQKIADIAYINLCNILNIYKIEAFAVK